MSTTETPAPVVYARKSQPVVVEPPIIQAMPVSDIILPPSENPPSSVAPLIPVEIMPPEDIIRAVDPNATLTAIANNLFSKNENEFPNNSPQVELAESKHSSRADIVKMDGSPVVAARGIPPKKQVFRPYNCSNCPQKAFRNQDTFEAHLCNAEDDLPQYRCRFCDGTTFQSESRWEDHEKAHAEKRMKKIDAHEGHGEALQKRKPSIGRKSGVTTDADSGLPLKKRGRPAKQAQTPVQSTAAKIQPQKKKVSEKLPPAMDKKPVVAATESEPQPPATPVSNGAGRNVTTNVTTPVQDAEPIPETLTTPNSGQRSQRKRVPPKWCENMIMEYDVAGVAGRGSRTPTAPTPTTVSEIRKEKILSLVDEKPQSAAVPTKRNEKTPTGVKGNATSKILKQETKVTPKIPVSVDDKSQSPAVVLTRASKPADVKVNTTSETVKSEEKERTPTPKISPVVDDKPKPALALPGLTKINEKNSISSQPADIVENPTTGTKQEEELKITANPPPAVNKSPPPPSSVVLVKMKRNEKNSITSKPADIKGNITRKCIIKPTDTQETPTQSTPIASPLADAKSQSAAPALVMRSEKKLISSKPMNFIKNVPKQEEIKPIPKTPPPTKVGKAEVIVPPSSAFPAGPTTRKRKLEDIVTKPNSEVIVNSVANGVAITKSLDQEPAKRARQSVSNKPMASPTKNNLPPLPPLTEIKHDITNGGGSEQAAGLNGYVESPIASTGSGQSSSFVGMPRLLNQSGVPIIDDSDNSSDDEDPSLPASATASNCSSSRPYIKDVVIRFLENKISNRNMLRIREELMTLKQGGNYFRLTKTAPLAAGLVHDMFCQSFGTHDPREDEETQ